MAQARTVSQLTLAVQQLGFPDPDGGNTIGSFLNEEYKTVAGERRWEWLQSSFTFSTVLGTFSYVLGSVSPGDIRNIDAVWATDASHIQYRTEYMDPLKLLDLNQNLPATTTGPPHYWTVWAGNMLFWPTPDAVYTVTVAYTKTLGDVPLTVPNSSDRPLLPGEYDMILVWGAAVMMATRLKDWLGRDFASQQRDRVLNNMRAEYQLKQRQTYDEVEQTGIWGPAGKSWQNEPGWW